MNNKLKCLLQYVEKNNLFYKNRFSKQGISFLNDEHDLTQNYLRLEKLQKKDIVGREKVLITNDHIIQRLEKQHTSGSTGIPLWIYKSANELFIQSLHLWNFRKKRANISPNDKYVRTHISQRNGTEINANRLIYESNFLSCNMLFIDETTLREYYNRIILFQPKWMLMNPSFLYIFTAFILNNGLNFPNIYYIELTGEYLSWEQEKYFSSIWKCEIANHYGCREVYAIALECECGNLHVVSENVFVEIEENKDFKEGYGNILITSLCGKAMPFIKYDIGDIGKIESLKCNCGNENPVLMLLGGRQSEYFDCHGEKVHSSIFHYIIKKVNLKNDDDIIFFQIKRNENKLVFMIKIKDNSRFEKISQDIIMEAKGLINNFMFSVKLMDMNNFVLSKGGKHNVLQDNGTLAKY